MELWLERPLSIERSMGNFIKACELRILREVQTTEVKVEKFHRLLYILLKNPWCLVSWSEIEAIINKRPKTLK